MASAEHCLYCFETLAAHLENRKPMTLDEIEESWQEYKASAGGGDGSQAVAAKTTPALRRVLAESSPGASGSLSSSASSASASSMSLGQAADESDTPDTSTSSLSTGANKDDTTSPLITESPLFVTWNTVSPRSGNTSLRGCIGTFEAQELDEGLSSYALISAVQDTRFDPITKRELPNLEVCVTLLTDFEDCDDAMDWEIGTHGLRISFTERGRRYGSTYLPDVAAEQGWTKEETLVSLMRKAGWAGRKDSWRDVKLKVVRYQGKKKELRYPEYKGWRDWVRSQEKEA
ncbi:AMMECR1 domain-containing protein [Microdochium trichocladiopsis]|uniref:AMMECR1 domain-containing protein n=1 Tax=Microdochium trichocladiopsis TaxID=1682393 RepID=A0A9P9BJQ0_9PEZI|nr:AMMECR1 domain-containing protein [Microdochium trichocladiopsis]KAH7018315.1 AMMECR1 domain-containing protein [Microdochium trichocladiopsis]